MKDIIYVGKNAQLAAGHKFSALWLAVIHSMFYVIIP